MWGLLCLLVVFDVLLFADRVVGDSWFVGVNSVVYLNLN